MGMGETTMITLGVNVDHVATLREQRKDGDPDLLAAVAAVMAGGADGITVHLREDRRHIQDADVVALAGLGIAMNLEMAAVDEMVSLACRIKPATCCLVPEKRQELTTEGGLNVRAQVGHLTDVVSRLQDAGIVVSLFVDPDPAQLMAAQTCGAQMVELNTAAYSREPHANLPYQAIKTAASMARLCGLVCHAGHGLSRDTLPRLVSVADITGYNIGHAIVSRALFVGLTEAVREIKDLLPPP